MSEEWRRIPGFSKYEASIRGEIRNRLTKKILRGVPDKDGYFRVNISNDEYKILKRLVHRLVAQTFIPNPNNHPVTNHLDGDKQNNNLSNLEWTTLSGNRQHAYDTGLQRGVSGEEHPSSKITETEVLEIRNLVREKTPRKEIAKRFNVNVRHIWRIATYKRWGHVK